MSAAEPMTRDEWKRRYAARISERSGWSAEDAAECAEIGAECYEQNERGAGNAVEWSCSEEEADEEMSYWDDDEGGGS